MDSQEKKYSPIPKGTTPTAEDRQWRASDELTAFLNKSGLLMLIFTLFKPSLRGLI